jgi:hypothetical protein
MPVVIAAADIAKIREWHRSVVRAERLNSILTALQFLRSDEDRR